jgi:outer membrane protein assembly factor BamE
LVRPYRVEVVQGNFVSREQVEALKPGMGRQQVREILGTPLLTSLFHDDRWDYVFTLKRPGLEAQTRKLTVFFKGDVLDRHEGDAMPTESEFVASLETRKGKGKVPTLEATEQQLARYPVQTPESKSAETDAAAPNASARTYPPLEPRTR